MLKTNYIITLTLLTLSLTLCGCNTTITNKTVDYTKESRAVNINNKEQYKQELLSIVQSGNTQNICTEDFIFNSVDIVENAELKQYYFFNGSIYLQINDKYMYRFQLNNDNNLVESYIKYNLEA